MPGSTGAGLDDSDRELVAEVGRRYDSDHHLENAADHSKVLNDDFIDRFAVIGTPDECVERLVELARVGFERFVITGPTIDADRTDARLAGQLLRDEVVPALRSVVR
jgi:5,10-methylenetetrahydromethanopterin reductase